MATAKEYVLHFVESLPEDLSFEELEKKLLEEVRYRRHVRQMIDEGLRDVAEGRTYSHEEAMKRLGIEP
jgi:hypothetical protein